MAINYNELSKKYAQVVVKTWEDNKFKENLLQSPTKILAEEGIDLPDDTQLELVEGGTTQSYDSKSKKLILPLPYKPTNSVDMMSLESSKKYELAACCCCCCF
ncbi:MAG: hypothetical protein ABF289_14590 [Clostridiales bacterium]